MTPRCEAVDMPCLEAYRIVVIAFHDAVIKHALRDTAQLGISRNKRVEPLEGTVARNLASDGVIIGL